MLSDSCFIQVVEYPCWLWLPWGHSLWLPGLYVAAMESRARAAPPDWLSMGIGKVEPALENPGLEEGMPGSEASAWSWANEGPGNELSVIWVFSVLGFLAACVACRTKKKAGMTLVFVAVR